MTTISRTSFTNPRLQHDIIFTFYSWSDSLTIFKCQLVCKNWQLQERHEIWAYLCRRDLPENYESYMLNDKAKYKRAAKKMFGPRPDLVMKVKFYLPHIDLPIHVNITFIHNTLKEMMKEFDLKAGKLLRTTRMFGNPRSTNREITDKKRNFCKMLNIIEKEFKKLEKLYNYSKRVTTPKSVLAPAPVTSSCCPSIRCVIL